MRCFQACSSAPFTAMFSLTSLSGPTADTAASNARRPGAHAETAFMLPRPAAVPTVAARDHGRVLASNESPTTSVRCLSGCSLRLVLRGRPRPFWPTNESSGRVPKAVLLQHAATHTRPRAPLQVARMSGQSPWASIQHLAARSPTASLLYL